MTQPPLTPAMARLEPFLPRLVAELEKGLTGAYAFAFAEETRSLTATVHRSDSVQSHTDRGIVLRLMRGGCNFETATNRLDPDHLLGLAASLRARAESIPSTPPPPAAPDWATLTADPALKDLLSRVDPKTPATTRVAFAPSLPPGEMEFDGAAILAEARSRREAAVAWDKARFSTVGGTEPLAFIMVSLRLRLTTHLFADRARLMSQTLPVTLATLLGQTAKGQSLRSLAGGMGGLSICPFTEEDYDIALAMPHRLDRAERLTPGAYRVLTAPDVTGVIAHEAFGHTQEGDTVRQGRSISPHLRKGAVGNKEAGILSQGALFASGTHRHGTNGSYFFDHEGRFAPIHPLILEGTLNDPMTDLLSAWHLGVKPTGNGKRESWRRPTLVRQTNTYFTWGHHRLEELLALMGERGFIARWSHGGMEDPKGANLTAGTEYLEEVVQGKPTGRLFVGPQGGHVELSGSVPEMLSNILGKTAPGPGDAPAPLNLAGGCGKYHKEYVQAGCGGPWILWDRLVCG